MGYIVHKSIDWERSSDYKDIKNIKTNDYIQITEETVNANKRFKMISTVSTLDTNPIEFTDRTIKNITNLKINGTLQIKADTTKNIKAIKQAFDGMIMYNTDQKKLYFYQTDSWYPILYDNRSPLK
tara:strand:- start:150 stop:527 length:378 start_codon:yes stop_codon:yes gene_type:complete